jgi:hypothetical protein
MNKSALVAIAGLLTITVLALPVIAADTPGKCGIGKYFDKKIKKCVAK